jgi:long-chain acyl-CoA synthetase
LVEKVSGRKVEDGRIDLSSIERVELQCALEERYQVALDESEIAGVKTVEELEEQLRVSSFEFQRQEQEPTLRFAQSGAPAVPQKPFQLKYEYPRWSQRWPVTWIRTAAYYMLAWPATYFLAWPRVVGSEKLRGLRGPVLVVCNHITYIDVGFVLAALPWRLRNKLAVAMEGERLWAMRNGGVVERVAYFLVVALFNVFPLPKMSGFRESFAYAGESVGRGHSVLVFPEGRRTSTGEMQRFQSGIGMLASGLDVPVVPMRIDGLFDVKGRWFARHGQVVVRVGEAMRFPPGMEADKIAGELEERVANL